MAITTVVLPYNCDAARAWWGFASARDVLRINGFLKKARKLNFHPPDGLPIEELWRKADDKLFDKICGNEHNVLYKVLPNKKDITYNLRERKHSFSLPCKDDRNFISHKCYSMT